MKKLRINPLRILAAFAASVVLMAGGATSAWANPPDQAEMRQNFVKLRQERIDARLAKAAARLEIKASQQAAWQALVKAIEEPIGFAPKKPDSPLGAAALARRHADVAAARAKKAEKVAEATAELEKVLTPDQRTTLDQLARQAMRRAHFHHRRDQTHCRMHKGMHGGMQRMQHGDGAKWQHPDQ